MELEDAILFREVVPVGRACLDLVGDRMVLVPFVICVCARFEVPVLNNLPDLNIRFLGHAIIYNSFVIRGSLASSCKGIYTAVERLL